MSNVSKWANDVHCGDSLDLLEEIPDNSVHAIVSDPPYGLNFMGKDWDNFRRRHNENDVDRDNVGGRLSAKAPASGAETDGKRYQEWCQKWAEKARCVLKPGGHLLAFSGNRTHHRLFSGVEDAGFEIRDTLTWHYGSGFPKNTNTQLKPSTEFVVMARKPCGGPAKDCFEEHGTAYLNVDECRLAPGEGGSRDGEETADKRYTEEGGTNMAAKPGPRGGSDKGRYPANLLLDDESANRLDGQSGVLESGELDFSKHQDTGSKEACYGEFPNADERTGKYGGDRGGASRFFYCSKANKSERTLDGRIANAHPTVKPVDLMEWLVKLVTREGQLVLDPFTGSGTTCKAAKNLNRRFIGIEKQEKWVDVARVRCGLTPQNPSHVRKDDSPQAGLEVYTDGGSPER